VVHRDIYSSRAAAVALRRMLGVKRRERNRNLEAMVCMGARQWQQQFDGGGPGAYTAPLILTK
jgi:hypothetical protein